MNFLDGTSTLKRFGFNEPSSGLKNGESHDEGSLKPKRFNVDVPSNEFTTFGFVFQFLSVLCAHVRLRKCYL